MAQWFLYFLIYSFLGYCLEKLFAFLTRSDRQVRKCFVLLPLCPVYGIAMTAVIAAAGSIRNFLVLSVAGGMICTAAEYLVHLFYDRVFQVKFWDYSGLSFHVNGRICPHFSLVWGLLSALTVRFVHPAVAIICAEISPAATFALWLILAADCVFTAVVLRAFRDTEALTLSRVLLSSDSPATPERRGRRTDSSSR